MSFTDGVFVCFIVECNYIYEYTILLLLLLLLLVNIVALTKKKHAKYYDSKIETKKHFHDIKISNSKFILP